MKTLKKVMAMTLAFATAMTMFVSASAFTDDADIKHEEAVGALSSLGIIKGNTDGSFAPKKTVTRGEMAKMIYVLRTGKDDGAQAYAGLSTTFTDIANSWAQPYIKYCYSQKIINGRSATKFDPDANVSGAEAAKMLLVCMGYDPAKAGLTGSSWALQTAALGSDKGLFKDVYQDLYEALNRENAAQEIYNSLDAKTVRFDGDDGAYTDKTITGADMDTVGEKFLDLETVTGTLLVSGNVGLVSGDDDKLEIAVDSSESSNYVDGVKKNGTLKDGEFDDVTTDYSALLGQDVKVLYKETKTSTTSTKTTVYGVYATDDNTVIKCKASDLEVVSGEKKIKVDGKKYTVDDSNNNKDIATAADNKLLVYNAIGSDKKVATDKLIQKVVAVDDSDIKDLIEGTSTTNYKGSKDSDYDVTVISNDGDNKIDMIIVNDKQFGKITLANNTKVSYSAYTNGNSGTVTSLDLDTDTPEIYKDYKKDDYVFAGINLFTGNVTLAKADKVSGTTQSSKSDEVQINGTWYDTTNTGKENLSVNKNTDLYVYGTYAYYTEGAASTDLDTLVVKSVGKYQPLDEGFETKVLFEDGTEKVINVEAIGDKIGAEKDTPSKDANVTKLKGKTDDEAKTAGLVALQMYTYEVDGSDYTLTPIVGNTQTAEQLVSVDGKMDLTKSSKDAGYNKDKESIGGRPLDDDAVIYIRYTKDTDDYKWKVESGKSIIGSKDLTPAVDGESTYVYNKDGDIVYAFIDSSDNYVSDNTLYGVVTDAYLKTNADGDKVVYMDLLTADGKKTGIETEDTTMSKNNLNNGDIISFEGDYTLAKDIRVLSDDAVNGTKGQFNKGTKNYGGYVAIDKQSSSKLVTFYNAAAPSAKVVSDTVVIYVDESSTSAGNWTAESNGSVSSAEQLSESTYKANGFYYVDNEDSEMALLVVDIQGELKDSNKTSVTLDKNA